MCAHASSARQTVNANANVESMLARRADVCIVCMYVCIIVSMVYKMYFVSFGEST